MATTEPMITMIGEIFDGRLKASNNPVTTADPSKRLVSFFNNNFVIKNSHNIAEATAVRVTINAPIPKKYNENKRVGINAMITPYISDLIVSCPYWWGEGDTTINLPIYKVL
jgi:hypothetical protein